MTGDHHDLPPTLFGLPLVIDDKMDTLPTPSFVRTPPAPFLVTARYGATCYTFRCTPRPESGRIDVTVVETVRVPRSHGDAE